MAEVSIVLPVFNDAEWIETSLESCLRQTADDIEIIVVDDASTDSTTSIVRRVQKRDSRVVLLEQATNQTAFQARRAGIHAATSPYVMFVDGDDELDRDAVKTALALAKQAQADVVGFGTLVINRDGSTGGGYESEIQPPVPTAHGNEIIESIFAPNGRAQGQLWRYLFDRRLLLDAYASLPSTLTLPRVNDLPIAFLTLMRAQTYVSTSAKLYRYYFRRGASGHRIAAVEDFEFTAGALNAVDAISEAVHSEASARGGDDGLLAAFQSTRRSVTGRVLDYVRGIADVELQATCMRLLAGRVDMVTLIAACADYSPRTLPVLAKTIAPTTLSGREPRHVLFRVHNLGTGGVQSVVMSQANTFASMGYRVTIVVDRAVPTDVDQKPGIRVLQLDGDSEGARLVWLMTLCADERVDVIIDHWILYHDNWQYTALAAAATGVPTIGWLHNFALRPIVDGVARMSFLEQWLPFLSMVVVLSQVDVAYWKLRGIANVAYLPNPPSPFLEHLPQSIPRRTAPTGTVELVWWGRLQQSTKQVNELVEIARSLHDLGVDFRLRVIGPNGADVNRDELRGLAAQRGIAERVVFTGPMHGPELTAAIAESHVFVSTSLIEGYQLAIIEAQSLGLPVVMYDLPWLHTVRGNKGVTTVPQGDRTGAARAIAALVDVPGQYERQSAFAREAAATQLDHDFDLLYSALVRGELASTYSPEPTMDDVRVVLAQNTRYVDRLIRGEQADDSQTLRARRERDRARSELRHIQEGPSFRIGRAITLAPRILRKLLVQRPSLRPRAQASSRVPTPAARREATPAPSAGDPDVSVVIPVYNSSEWLEDCISSVLAQSDVNVEVICVDDGSTDESPQILRRLSETDARVSVTTQSNSGQSTARNAGQDLARGRYLVYLDSDDFWSADALAALVARADEDELDVLFFDGTAIREHDAPEDTWQKYAQYYPRAKSYAATQPGIEMLVQMRRANDYRPHIGMFLARTSFVRESRLRFIPGIVHQDNPYTFRMMLNASRTAHEALTMYARRIRANSTIASLSAERSAHGYFVSAIAMIRERRNHDLPRAAARWVDDVIGYVEKGARTQIAQLAPSDQKALREVDTASDARELFTRLTT